MSKESGNDCITKEEATAFTRDFSALILKHSGNGSKARFMAEVIGLSFISLCKVAGRMSHTRIMANFADLLVVDEDGDNPAQCILEPIGDNNVV